MAHLRGRRLIPLVCWMLALAVGGCANTGKGGAWKPFGKKPKPLPAGVVLPSERIASLRQLTAEAGKADPEKKRRISAELARSFSVEEDTMIRAEVVRALRAYPGPEADAVLRTALNDPDSEVRIVACEVWAKRGDAESVHLLSTVLSGDVDKDVRLAAARMLGQSKNPAAVAALGEILVDKDPAMQYRAVMSLREITGKDFGNDVGAWRQYVKGETPKPTEPVSVAERLRHMLYW